MESSTRSEQSAQGILWLKLSEESKHQLHEVYPPKYPQEFYDHVTLVFDAKQEAVSRLIGQKALVHARAHAYNEQVQAVRIDTHGLPDTYGVPHVTLSTQEGVGPFEAVAMLRSQHHEALVDPPLELDGTVEFIPFASA